MIEMCVSGAGDFDVALLRRLGRGWPRMRRRGRELSSESDVSDEDNALWDDIDFFRIDRERCDTGIVQYTHSHHGIYMMWLTFRLVPIRSVSAI